MVCDARGVDAIRDAAWTEIIDAAGVVRRKMTPEGLYGRKKMTALIRRTAIADASRGAVGRAMRALGLARITRARRAARGSRPSTACEPETCLIGTAPRRGRITSG